jgi:hypothetical protein
MGMATGGWMRSMWRVSAARMGLRAAMRGIARGFDGNHDGKIDAIDVAGFSGCYGQSW